MTDQEINKALALAIGWREDQMTTIEGRLCCEYIKRDCWSLRMWFDYRDPAVIWPIAKRCDLFPRRRVNRARMWVVNEMCIDEYQAATPEKAVAMAVIGGAE